MAKWNLSGGIVGRGFKPVRAFERHITAYSTDVRAGLKRRPYEDFSMLKKTKKANDVSITRLFKR